MLIEKSSPIREQGGFMGEGDSSKPDMANGDENNSILEYGPGIVRKLRSIYQSLSIRQSSSRPSLWKSASMENVLDVDVTDGINGESFKSSSFEQKCRISNVFDKRTDKVDSGISAQRMTKSKSTTAVPERNQQPAVNETGNGNMYEKKPGPRGRAAVSERRDRMRRARSVDALQRTKHEEEILEKFKAVVLPKEEIVIIEVSKPRANLNGLGLSNNSTTFYLATSAGDKSYPTQLMINPDRLAGAESPQAGIRARSFVSPEHELPPQDIVRETARIFEKNQENSKRLGQALRLSKSPTNSHPTSPVMSCSQDMPFSQKYDKGNSQSAKSTAIKQVGVIRPTVNTGGATLKYTDRKGVDSDLENSIVSPILNPTSNLYKAFLLQNAQKPPLSPKPLFASSPKTSQSSEDAENPPVPTAFPRKFATSSGLTADKKPDHPQALNTSKLKVEPPKMKNVIVENGASAPKGKESAEEMRRSLKHVPNSFSIDKDEPFPAVTSVKSSPASNPTVKPRTGERHHFGSVPFEKKIAVTAKIVETPKPIPVNSSIENSRPSATPVEPKVVAKINSAPDPEPNNGSQLRAHQKQKSTQGGNSTMVFNFTGRSSVPDYIEDDGLHRGRMTLAGTVTDESVDDIDTGDAGSEELVNFIGANVIINGKSSIQKKPKSAKVCILWTLKTHYLKITYIYIAVYSQLNISFNDERSTYEYPSETSLLAEEETTDKDLLGHKGPNVINNNGSKA